MKEENGKNIGIKKIPPQESLPQNPNLLKNKLGGTYGADRDISPYEKGPDLIKARGVNGKSGYIRQTELDGEPPKSIEEALAQQAKKEVRVVNVYESDGITVIDQFEIRPVSDESKKRYLKRIMMKFAESGWDLIESPAKAWLEGKGDKNALISAVEQADKECGSCGCEFDTLYKRVLQLKELL